MPLESQDYADAAGPNTIGEWEAETEAIPAGGGAMPAGGEVEIEVVASVCVAAGPTHPAQQSTQPIDDFSRNASPLVNPETPSVPIKRETPSVPVGGKKPSVPVGGGVSGCSATVSAGGVKPM